MENVLFVYAVCAYIGFVNKTHTVISQDEQRQGDKSSCLNCRTFYTREVISGLIEGVSGNCTLRIFLKKHVFHKCINYS
jgi:hypothetical protein